MTKYVNGTKFFILFYKGTEMRQIVLDTETTGLDPKQGHRIIEIGCVEMINRRLTGNTFHVYINPQRLVEQEAIGVHGITNEYLADKPIFKTIAKENHNLVMNVDYYKKKLTNLQLRSSINISNSQSNLLFNTDTEAFYRKFLDEECDEVFQK